MLIQNIILVVISYFLICITSVIAQVSNSRFEPPNSKLDSVYTAVGLDSVEYVAQWLADGGDIDIVDKIGYSMLSIAARENAVNVIQLLIYSNIDVNHIGYLSRTPLIIAASAGNLKSIQLLLDNGADPNDAGQFGTTPLHYAARYSMLEMAETLLENGADPNILDSSWQTPIFASMGGDNPKMVELLLKFKAEVNIIDKTGQSPIFNAVSHGRLKNFYLAMNAGSELSVIDTLGNSLLHVAATYNNSDAIRQLISGGFNIDDVNASGETPLELALQCSRIRPLRYMDFEMGCGTTDGSIIPDRQSRKWLGYDSFKLLVDSGADFNKIDWEKHGNLLRLAEYDNPELIQRAVANGADVNIMDSVRVWTPLHKSAAFNNVKVAQWLIDHGADMKTLNQSAQTPLTIAILYENPEMVSLLINNGADVNFVPIDPAQTNDGELAPERHRDWGNLSNWRPIQWAILLDSPKTVKLLIEAGSDIFIKSYNGGSLLHDAMINNKVEIMRILIEAGVKVTDTDLNGNTPLKAVLPYSRSPHEAVRILLENGAETNLGQMLHHSAKRGDLSLIMLLIEHGADVNSIDKYGLTALQYTTNPINPAITMYLLNNGADPYLKDRNEVSVLHRACANLAIEVVKILIEKGMDVNIKDLRGFTPLFWVIKPIKGNYPRVDKDKLLPLLELLLKNGARWDITIENTSLFEWAIEANSFEIVNYLYAKGADIHCYDNDRNNLLMRISGRNN